MKTKASVNTRPFETLESRQCMAGNVTAVLAGGDLLIDGDVLANAIRVIETSNDGEFTITGLNDGAGTATSVNGTPNGTATIAGVSGNIIVNLMAGDDALTLNSVSHAGSLTLDVGAGNDSIHLGSASGAVSIGGAVNLHVGDDRNTVTISHLTVGGHFMIDAIGTAPDDVPNTYRVTDSLFQQNAVMQLGDRTGTISVSNVTVRGRLEMDNALQEPPFFGSVNGYAVLRLEDAIVSGNLNMQSWASTLVALDNVFVGQTTNIQAFQHYNAIQVNNSRFVFGLQISTLIPTLGIFGPGESLYDDLAISGIIVDRTIRTTTSGDLRVVYSNINDAGFTMEGLHSTVTVDTNIFATASFSLGAGDDTFTIANSIVHGRLTVVHSRFYTAGPADPVQRGYNDYSSSMSFNSNRIGQLSITGGNETDLVHITYNIIDQVFADMDFESSSDGNRAGSDLFEITGSIVNQSAYLDGSGSFDLFRNNGSVISGLSLANFEAF